MRPTSKSNLLSVILRLELKKKKGLKNRSHRKTDRMLQYKLQRPQTGRKAASLSMRNSSSNLPAQQYKER